VIIVALENKTKIRVVPGSHHVKLKVPGSECRMKRCIELELSKGEVLIMHPLLFHGGSSFQELNFRVLYLGFDNDYSFQKLAHYLDPSNSIDQMILRNL
jgi:ectoine hydroxylase-related dioxygenase (phytanoyl-CoA dioxygenase family)